MDRRGRRWIAAGAVAVVGLTYFVVPMTLIERAAMQRACAGTAPPRTTEARVTPDEEFFRGVERLEWVRKIPGYGARAGSEIGLGVSRCLGAYMAACVDHHSAASNRALQTCRAEKREAHECGDRMLKAKLGPEFILQFHALDEHDRAFCRDWSKFQSYVGVESCGICAER